MTQLERAPAYYPMGSRHRFMFKISHEGMVRRFGEAHRLMDAEDDEPGPCEFWGYRVDDHDVLIVFHFAIPDGPAAIVESAMTDIDRMIDALGVREMVTWRSDAAM